MLKIKDNVDLKELEKFGFERDDGFYSKEIYDDNMSQGYLSLTDSNRNICISLYEKEKKNYPMLRVLIDDTLYDLIKADLVEKVEE